MLIAYQSGDSTISLRTITASDPTSNETNLDSNIGTIQTYGGDITLKDSQFLGVVYSIAWNPNTTQPAQLAFGSQDNLSGATLIQIWNLGDAINKPTFSVNLPGAPTMPVTSIAWNPTMLAVGSLDGSILLFTPPNSTTQSGWAPSKTIVPPTGGEVMSMAWSPTQALALILFGTMRNNKASYFNTKEVAVVPQFEQVNVSYSVIWINEGQFATGDGKVIKIWNINSGSTPALTLPPS